MLWLYEIEVDESSAQQMIKMREQIDINSYGFWESPS